MSLVCTLSVTFRFEISEVAAVFVVGQVVVEFVFEAGFRHRLDLVPVLCDVLLPLCGYVAGVVEDGCWLFVVDLCSPGGVEGCLCWFVSCKRDFFACYGLRDFAVQYSVCEACQFFVDKVGLFDQLSPSSASLVWTIGEARAAGFEPATFPVADAG